MKSRKKATGLILFILAIIFSMCVFLFYCNKKSVWFCDEVYTLESSNGVYKEWPRNLANVWQQGAAMEEYFAATGDGLYYSGISVALYDDHVPLYFWLFRTIAFALFKGKATFFPGFIINALFYLATFVLVWVVFSKVTETSIVPFIVCIFAFNLSPMFLAQETMIRMYMMLLADAMFLLACAYVIFCNAIKKRYKISPFIFLTIVSVIGLLTHFDYWVFYATTAFVFCLTMLIWGLAKSEKPFFKSVEFYAVLSWGCSFVISMIMTIKVFPYCIWNIRRDKGKTALDSLLVFSKYKADLLYRSIQELVNNVAIIKVPTLLGLFILVALWIIASIVLFNEKRVKEFWCFILSTLTSLGYVFVVAFTMPAEFEIRYFWPAYSILFLLTFYGACIIVIHFYKKWEGTCNEKRIMACLPVAAILIAYVYAAIHQIDAGRGVPYLYSEEKDMNILEANAEMPWIVYGGLDAYSSFDYVIPKNFLVLDCSDKIGAVNAVIEMERDKPFVLYCSDGLVDEALGFVGEIQEKKLEATFLTRSINYGVYLVK